MDLGLKLGGGHTHRVQIQGFFLDSSVAHNEAEETEVGLAECESIVLCESLQGVDGLD